MLQCFQYRTFLVKSSLTLSFNLHILCITYGNIAWVYLLHIVIRILVSVFMIWYDMTWHDMTWHDMTWHDMTWHDMTWHDMTWHDLTWHDMIYDYWWWLNKVETSNHNVVFIGSYSCRVFYENTQWFPQLLVAHPHHWPLVTWCSANISETLLQSWES